MRSLLTALVLLVTVGPIVSPAGAQEPRRAQLEMQVRQQFLTQVSDRLSLDATQRQRLQDVLQRGAEARRALAQESRQLRGELVRAVDDEGTPMDTHQRLLDRLRDLQTREQALERREAAALAEFLDARQQAQFLVLRMQLNDRVRGMRGARPGGPGGPGDRAPQRRGSPGG